MREEVKLLGCFAIFIPPPLPFEHSLTPSHGLPVSVKTRKTMELEVRGPQKGVFTRKKNIPSSDCAIFRVQGPFQKSFTWRKYFFIIIIHTRRIEKKGAAFPSCKGGGEFFPYVHACLVEFFLFIKGQ